MSLPSGTTFTKGHGTGNDFVLVSDPDDLLDLTAADVRQLCDRRFGIGGDGLIRAVRSSHMVQGRLVLDTHPDAEWFMDYRNGDGSVAQMCGNGVRVFVHYLVETGLAVLPVGSEMNVGTRAGARRVRRLEEGYSVDMGPWAFIHPEAALRSGSDSLVTVAGLEAPRPAVSIDMGNPHTVLVVGSDTELEHLDLNLAPQVEPVPLQGTNVEIIEPSPHLVHDGMGDLRMRVHERGVGETLSCGTGACAAAAAARFWAGEDAPDTWLVQVPGGVLKASFFTPEGSTAEHVELSGPAELLYTGVWG